MSLEAGFQSFKSHTVSTWFSLLTLVVLDVSSQPPVPLTHPLLAAIVPLWKQKSRKLLLLSCLVMVFYPSDRKASKTAICTKPICKT